MNLMYYYSLLQFILLNDGADQRPDLQADFWEIMLFTIAASRLAGVATVL
jgi:hypothetical protein